MPPCVPTNLSAESYFATQPPSAREFVARHTRVGRRVVLMRGGTTVPLELVERSLGTRVGASPEYFLKAGYAFSLQPISRHYSHLTNPFLDFLETHNGNELPEITIALDKRRDLLLVLAAYKTVQAAGVLLVLTFVTVNDYWWLLRAQPQTVDFGQECDDYFAVASEHKVRKILKPMVDKWTKDSYIVSFKLETVPSLLILKSRAALERYGHSETVVPEFGELWLRILSSMLTTTSTEDRHVKDIEEDIVS
ncbi:phosphopantothenate-cysteine ligase [Amanita muscaria]